MVFSFGSPQEYSADFVMATLATGDSTTDHQQTVRPPATTAPRVPTSTSRPSSNRPSTSNNRPASINKQRVSIDHNDIVTTPPPAISIAETPNKDDNSASWLQERTVVANTNDHNGDDVVNDIAVEDNREFVTNSRDRETDNLLDSLFDDIVNDDAIDNVYGFSHQHQHTSTGNQHSQCDTPVLYCTLCRCSKER